MLDTDVLVSGAGPTGLMLADWLARAGVRALVVDDKPGPVRESRAVGVQARTLETYDMLGLGARAMAEGLQVAGAAVWVGHHRVAHAVLGEMGAGISPHPYLFTMGQDRTERLLLDDLRAHGGEVAYATTLLSIEQDEDHVYAEIVREGAGREQVRARWAVGCDGGKSRVRHALGLRFEGGTYPQRFFVADVTARGPIGHGELGLCASPDGFLALFPLPGEGHYRVIGIVPPEIADAPDLNFEHVRDHVHRESAMTVTATGWFATYNVHHRVAEHFRAGRIFLAGDAGHVHSPVGGQGMNTGLMDATNLAWKLAAVAKGLADPKLLDTYEPERIPFARQLVHTTDGIFSLVAGPTGWLTRARGVVMPIFFALATHLPVLRRELFGLISQTRIHYPDSALSRGRAGMVSGGDRLPWVRYPDGTSNFDTLSLLRPHLQVYGDVPAAVRAFADAHPGLPLVALPGGPEVRRAGLEPGAAYFIRPDGHVAYAASTFSADDFLRYMQTAWGSTPEALGTLSFAS